MSTITLFVRNAAGVASGTISVGAKEEVSFLKKKIAELLDAKPNSFEILHEGEALEPNTTMEELSFQEGSTIDVRAPRFRPVFESLVQVEGAGMVAQDLGYLFGCPEYMVCTVGHGIAVLDPNEGKILSQLDLNKSLGDGAASGHSVYVTCSMVHPDDRYMCNELAVVDVSDLYSPRLMHIARHTSCIESVSVNDVSGIIYLAESDGIVSCKVADDGAFTYLSFIETAASFCSSFHSGVLCTSRLSSMVFYATMSDSLDLICEKIQETYTAVQIIAGRVYYLKDGVLCSFDICSPDVVVATRLPAPGFCGFFVSGDVLFLVNETEVRGYRDVTRGFQETY
eukprot:TRINITY_DN21485_c0_g2_i1.p1 TRINITY_DN21485_c0_g2~~TRINITY_DN21485_c0_g2_i1.p1  ORF type:complete len:340 (+),score=46.80 TRINITY_DN21485_c0_g2_i1:152-1171(+)